MRPITDGYQVGGNQEVIELFERWLSAAKRGRLRYAAVIACEGPTHVDVEFAGIVGCEFASNWGCDLLKNSLHRPRNVQAAGNLGADYAFYNMETAPICYDFASWLVDQEMNRRREGAPAPLKVAFGAPGTNRKVRPNDKLVFKNVIRPMLSMIGAVEDDNAKGASRRFEFYCLRPVSEAAERGEEVPKFLPSPDAVKRVKAVLGGCEPVTITLREAEHWPHRNSNMEAWQRFARDLQNEGHRVIFLRDTAKADEPLPGFETCEEASRDLHFRLALYEQAKCNLFVSNGPWSLAAFGKKPWLLFHEVSEDDPFFHNRPDNWAQYCGVPIGGQFPWSGTQQRIVWANDDYENLCSAWAEFSSEMECAA